MKIEFYNNNTKEFMMNGENLNRVYIYNNGEILAELYDFETDEVENGKIRKNEKTIEKIYLNGEIKRANKLNLSRKDNFIFKNTEKEYNFEPSYNLYIHVSEVNYKYIGDVLANEFNNEKNYFEVYKIAFPCIVTTERAFERVVLKDGENYKLKDGETFGDWYGENKHNAIVKPYEITKESFLGRREKSRVGEKGIVRKWIEETVLENESVLLHKPYYSKCIKDDYRLEAERTAKKLNEILGSHKNLSYYDIDRLQQSGVKITFKEN